MKKYFMKKQIKNRYLVYIVLSAYILGSFLGIFIHNVSAISSTLSEGFESGESGKNFTGVWLKTDPDTNLNIPLLFKVGVNRRSGNFGFNAYDTGGYYPRGYFNFTYDHDYLLTGFSCWIKIISGTIPSYNIQFANQTSSSVLINIDITNSGGYPRITFTDHSLVEHILVSKVTTQMWYKIGFTVNSRDNITYYTNGTSMYGTPYTILNESNSKKYWHVDYAYLGGNTAVQNKGMYMDDFNITIADSLISTGETICGYDISSYGQRGNTNYYRSQVIDYPYIYENFKVPITTSIKGISLAVDPTQYYDDSNLNNYSCSLNDYSLGYPDCFYSNGDTYILFWDCNIGIENETLSFNFTHTKQSYNNRYWIVCTGRDSAHDLDLDGDITFGSDEYLGQTCEWKWIWILPFWVCTDNYKLEYNYDLSYKFYYTTIETPNTYNYTDSLGLFGYTYKNSTGYIYDINTPNGIIGSYTISDRGYSYSIDVYKNGTLFNTIGFPLSCNYPSGSFGLSPNTIGKYQFKLKKVGYVYNITAYVTGEYSNFFISTNPPITNQFESYDVNYRYYHQQGLNGSIGMFYLLEDINTFSRNDFSSDIITNTTGSLNYASSYTSVEYWRLFVNRNSIYTPVGNLAKHFIRIPSILDNTISFLPITLNITGNNAEGKQIIITGHHTFAGCDVKVYANEIYVSSVGENQNFITFFKPSNIGIYTISLRINQDGIIKTIAIAQDVLTVTSTEDIPPTENVLSFIQPPYSYFVGVAIIILLTITPIIIGAFFHVDLNNIPQFLYMVFAIIGFIISILFGFFPSWTIAVLIIISVIILVIMWLQRKIA